MTSAAILEQLALARRIADHADRLGVQRAPVASRVACEHLGAVLADAVLQAGVSYRTVVRIRIERILSQFPETATLSGLTALIEYGSAADFLLWNHPTKVTRFLSLAQLLALNDIETTFDLKHWLWRDDAREHMLDLHGIGPKTHDYLCCLVGIDCIAVDRHIRTFASEAGVTVSDYNGLKSAVSYAADLLGMARRDFDAWIWRTISARRVSDRQLTLV
jgi:hypothetical protein